MAGGSGGRQSPWDGDEGCRAPQSAVGTQTLAPGAQAAPARGLQPPTPLPQPHLTPDISHRRSWSPALLASRGSTGIRALPPGLGTRDPSHGATGHPALGSAPWYRARSIAELQPRGTSGLGGGHPKGPQDPQPPRHGAGEGTSTPFGAGERDRAVPQPRCLHSWHPGAAPRCYSNTKPWDAMPFKRGTARLGLNY